MSAVEARRAAARFEFFDAGGEPDARGEYAAIEVALREATSVTLSPELVQAFHRAWAAEPLRVEDDRHVKQTIRALCAAIGIEVRE